MNTSIIDIEAIRRSYMSEFHSEENKVEDKVEETSRVENNPKPTKKPSFVLKINKTL